VPIGVIAAWRVGTWVDRVVMGFSVLGFSVPVFVFAYLLMFVFAIELEWLPVQGYVSITEASGRSAPHDPASVALGTVYMRSSRASRGLDAEVLAQDYIRTARRRARLARRPDAPCPQERGGAIVTVIGIGIALLISGVVSPRRCSRSPASAADGGRILRRDYPISRR